MNELVKKLTNGQHPIAAERSESALELREQIDREFVLLKFTKTKGGTELGAQLDKKLTQIDEADFENGTGTVHLVGNLTLDYTKVQLIADIDLSTLKGTGHLTLVEEEADIVKKKVSVTKKPSRKKSSSEKKKALKSKSNGKSPAGKKKKSLTQKHNGASPVTSRETSATH